MTLILGRRRKWVRRWS